MPSKLLLLLRIYSSLVILTGVAALLMGLGIMDVNPNLEVAAATVLGRIPYRVFFVFLGLSKILGVLGLWGKGIFSWQLSFVALGTPAMCGLYAHIVLEEGLQGIFAGSYLAALSLLYHLEKPSESESRRHRQ